MDLLNDTTKVLDELKHDYLTMSRAMSGNTDEEGTTEPATRVEIAEHIVATTPFHDIIKLNIGGRILQTLISTLRSESGLFRRQLSDKFTWTPAPDGSYFLDADPDLFEHLLRFMRRPEVFPLLYTKANGFDYDLYNKLEKEAEYFQIKALHEWIKDRKYLMAVVERTEVFFNASEAAEYSANNSQDLHMIPRTRKVYLCPRGIFVHRGDRNRCGQACMKARGGEDEFEEEAYMEIVGVRKHVVFDASLCSVA